jgi:hypothetical protein
VRVRIGTIHCLVVDFVGGARNVRVTIGTIYCLFVDFVGGARNVRITIGTISLSGYGLCEEVQGMWV